MLVCPFCESELLEKDLKDGGWVCECGEFVPEMLACDTSKRKCGCKDCH